MRSRAFRDMWLLQSFQTPLSLTDFLSSPLTQFPNDKKKNKGTHVFLSQIFQELNAAEKRQTHGILSHSDTYTHSNTHTYTHTRTHTHVSAPENTRRFTLSLPLPPSHTLLPVSCTLLQIVSLQRVLAKKPIREETAERPIREETAERDPSHFGMPETPMCMCFKQWLPI